MTDSNPYLEKEPKLLDLTPIKTRLAAASAAPWGWAPSKPKSEFTSRLSFGGFETDHMRGSSTWTNVKPRDAEFIAHAREDVPALIAEVERLRAELAHAKHLVECEDTFPCDECNSAYVALGYRDPLAIFAQ